MAPPDSKTMKRPKDADDPAADSSSPEEHPAPDPDEADANEEADNEGEEGKEGVDEEYEVERILDEETDEDGDLYYFIRWRGYSPSWDTREPASGLENCPEVVAEWEREKAARASARRSTKRKSRSRSVHSDESESNVSSRGSAERRKKKRKRSKRTEKNDSDDGSDSEASRGTHDSYMDELKAKNEGTYKWEDVDTGKHASPSDSEDASIMSITERERQRRKSKKTAPRSPPRRWRSPVSTSPLKPRLKPPSSRNPDAPVLPSFMSKPAVNSLKRSKRKPGEATLATKVNPGDRRQKPLSLSRQNAIKKKRREEPPPDADAIPVFRPADVLTAAGRTMKSGRGFDKSVGDIDAAISLVQEQTSANSGRKMSFGGESPDEPLEQLHSRRKSVTEALTIASKIINEPSPPRTVESHQMEDTDADAIRAAWLGPPPVSPAEPLPTQTSASISKPASIAPSASSATRALPSRSQSMARRSISGELPRASQPPPPARRASSATARRTPIEDGPSNALKTTNILPTLMEETWSGELLYSTELKSLGSIRLLVPESSTRIRRVPKFSRTFLSLQKLVSVQYVTQKWFSPLAHPTNKPECLSVQFENTQSLQILVETLKSTESVGLVIDEACTLFFFFKFNERLRGVFIGDSGPEPIGVALLQPLKLSNSLNGSSPADENRKTPYNSLLISEKIDSYIPPLRRLPYTLYSPNESLETLEMHQIMATRRAVPTDSGEAKIVIIHRLYQPILNFLPSLTELKRSRHDPQIFLFGSYLDYETIDGRAKSVSGSQLMRIFPGGGRICFTMDHLLENPSHISKILEYTDSRLTWKVVLPHGMVAKFDKLAPDSVKVEDAIDIQLAVAAIREHIKNKKVQVADYRLEGVGVNSYLPFMTFIQHELFDSVKRFLLIHPEPVDTGLWNASGNGIEVYSPEEFEKYFKVQNK